MERMGGQTKASSEERERQEKSKSLDTTLEETVKFTGTKESGAMASNGIPNRDRNEEEVFDTGINIHKVHGTSGGG